MSFTYGAGCPALASDLCLWSLFNLWRKALSFVLLTLRNYPFRPPFPTLPTECPHCYSSVSFVCVATALATTTVATIELGFLQIH